MVTNHPLTIYPTQAATGSGSTSFSTDATGVAQCYTREKRFDVIITISGLSTRVIPDSQGQPVRSPSSWVNAADFPDLGAAIAQVPTGCNYGIECDVPSDGSKVGNLTIERVNVVNMGDDCIHLHALGTNDSFFVFVALRDIQCIAGKARGLYASYANLLNCYGCYFNGNDLDGVRADDCEIAFFGCAFENNCTSNTTTGSFKIDPMFDGQAYIRSCTISRFDACHFENFTGSGHPQNKRALMIENSPGCVVSGCSFFNGAEDTSSVERGIHCTFGAGFQTPVPGVMACAFLPNTFANVHNAIVVDGGSGAAQDCIVFPQRVSAGTGNMSLPTGLSDSGVMALGNRKLGTGGFARGMFMPPRVNTTSDPLPSLSGDSAGYILFDTTNQTLRIWDGGSPGCWLTVTTT